MQLNKYLYLFGYDKTLNDLCKLESKFIFGQEEKDKLLISDIDIDPSISAFIKKRLEIITFSKDYTTLISKIKEKNICIEGFKAEYLVLDNDKTEYDQRLRKLKDVGLSIKGNPDYYNPTITYGLCFYKEFWCFGLLNKNSFDWHKHNKKPRSYSHSINIHIAKALVNIAVNGKKKQTLLDACCGVGTIILEACFAKVDIDGCDINWKVCRDARENLAHFGYTSTIYRSDIKDITKKYDAAIIDLPYNLLSSATDEDTLHIIKSTTNITNRLIIVSIKDIRTLINEANLEILITCSISKRGKSNFARTIWVCEK